MEPLCIPAQQLGPCKEPLLLRRPAATAAGIWMAPGSQQLHRSGSQDPSYPQEEPLHYWQGQTKAKYCCMVSFFHLYNIFIKQLRHFI